MNRNHPPLAPILRSRTQGRLLALLFERPDQEFTLATLAQRIGKSQSTVWREIDKALESHLIKSHRVGNALLVQANKENRYFSAMREIVIGAFGAPEVITERFSQLEGIHALAIFGSWAARFEGEIGDTPKDVDVLVIGEPNRDELYTAADYAEKDLGFPVQVTVRSIKQWINPDLFLSEVKARPIYLLYADAMKPELNDLHGKMEKQV